VSSATRVAGLNVPTLREQGVNIELENWRSLVAPPGLDAVARARLEATVEQMVRSDAWRDTLARFRWNDRYLAGAPFAAFVGAEQARVRAILSRLGTAEPASPSSVGAYPRLVLAALLLTVVTVGVGIWRGERVLAERPGAGWVGVATSGLGMLAAWALLERAGFLLAAGVLFWLTARAFDPRHPLRDAALSVGVSLGTYLLFARVLQLPLPAAPLLGVR
jgi:putative tricarboxylic transport membrane protein